MTTTTKTSRKPLRAPHGTVAWVGDGAIRITREGDDPETYAVFKDADGYWLTKADGKVYFLDTSDPRLWACSCPDAAHRPERKHCCKHTCALRAALARVPF